MTKLQYDNLYTFRNSVNCWDGLVAGFILERKQTHGFSQEILQVYLDHIPEVQQPNLRVITLDELQQEALGDEIIFMAAFAALDVIRLDLLFRGPSFYALEKLFLKEGQLEPLGSTIKRLVLWLSNYLSDLPEEEYPKAFHHAKIKLIKTCLYLVLNKIECRNLMALVIPDDLAAFLKEENYYPLYLDPEKPEKLKEQLKENWKEANTWIVAMRELCFLDDTILPDAANFIELREVLRYPWHKEVLKANTTALALAFQSYARLETSLLDIALGLKLESLLFSKDVDDLLAVCLNRNFEGVSGNGVLYVYRTLSTDEKFGGACSGSCFRASVTSSSTESAILSVGQLTLETSCPFPAQKVLISFPPIQKRLESCYFNPTLNLGRAIWNTGHVRILARTLWLFYRYMLESEATSQEAITEERMTLILEPIMRAITLYGLWNPWEWRMYRWELDLGLCYADLLEGLDKAANNITFIGSARHYYKVLKAWYSFSDKSTSSSIKKKLQEILDEQRRFDSTLEAAGKEGEAYKTTLLTLIGFVEKLLYSPKEDKHLEVSEEISAGREISEENWSDSSTAAYEIIRQTEQKAACNWELPLPIPSEVFTHAWNTLLNKRRKRQVLVYNQDLPTGELSSMLKELKDGLTHLRRLLYAPLHEKRLLEYAYDEEISRINSLLDELDRGVRVNITLANPDIFMHQEVDLIFRVSNQGSFEAKNLVILIRKMKGLHLGTGALSSRHAFPKLGPKESHTLNLPVRPVDIRGANVRLDMTYHDHEDHKHTLVFDKSLNVRHRAHTAGVNMLKKNPYQFGLPVDNPALFYGRKPEMSKLLSGLVGPSSHTFLIGSRRIGKSSFLLMLKYLLEHPASRRHFNIPVDWDVELDRFKSAYISLQSLSPTPDSSLVRQFFLLLLREVAKAVAIPNEELEELMGLFGKHEKETGPLDATRDALKTLMEKRPEMRALILLDEYDEIHRQGNAQIGVNLRDLAIQQKEIPLTLVISSTVALYSEGASFSSPLHNIFKISSLGKLEEEDAQALVVHPSAEIGVEWSSDAVIRLLKNTGYRPAYIQLFCQEVIEELRKAQNNFVTQELVNNLAEKMVENLSTFQTLFEDIWKSIDGIGQLILSFLIDKSIPIERDEIRHYVLQQLNLLAVPEETKEANSTLEGRSVDRANEQLFRRAMEWLENVSDVISPNRQRRYEFSVPLFKVWLKHRFSLEREFLPDILEKIKADGLKKDG